MNYQVDDLTIDVGQRRVEREGEALDIGGLTFDLLQAIVEGAPNIISSDELIEKVWSGRPTSPETITQRAMMLRQALGDDADNPKYVEVVRGQGFRLIPELRNSAGETTRFSKNNYTLVVAAVVVLGVIAAMVFPGRESERSQESAIEQTNIAPAVESQRLPRSVAVLPFADLSPDPDNAYFAAGLHGEILNQLGHIGALNVIARTSVLQYENAARPIKDIAEELNVGTVMEGSVSYADGRVAIRVQLIDAGSNAQLWAESYNAEFADVFAVQADVARNVATALKAEFSLQDLAVVESIPTTSLEAYALYLQAQDIFGSGLGNSWDKPHGLLERAVQLDPNFALAHATRANWYAWILGFGQVELATKVEFEQAAIKHAELALAIDQTFGFAHSAIAITQETLLNFAAAEVEFEKSRQLSPNDALVLMPYGRFLRNIGNYDEAIRLTMRTIELDPNNYRARHQLGLSYRFSGQFEQARAAFAHALQMVPSSQPGNLEMAFVLAHLGEKDAALQKLRLIEQLMIDNPSVVPIWRDAQMVVVSGLAGGSDFAAPAFERFRERAVAESAGPVYWAWAYIGIGEHELALEKLEAAAQDPKSIALAPLMEIRAFASRDSNLDTPEFAAVYHGLGLKYVDELP